MALLSSVQRVPDPLPGNSSGACPGVSALRGPRSNYSQGPGGGTDGQRRRNRPAHRSAPSRNSQSHSPAPVTFPGSSGPGRPDSSRTRLHPPTSLVPGQDTRGVHAAVRPHRLTLSSGLGDSVSVNRRCLRSRIECFSLWKVQFPRIPSAAQSLASNGEASGDGSGQQREADRGGWGGAGEALHSPVLPPGCVPLWERPRGLPPFHLTCVSATPAADKRRSHQPSSCATGGGEVHSSTCPWQNDGSRALPREPYGSRIFSWRILFLLNIWIWVGFFACLFVLWSVCLSI